MTTNELKKQKWTEMHNITKDNKNLTNWFGQAKRSATQFENLCRNSVSLVGDLRQTVTELCDSLSAGPILRTFMQYSGAFRSWLEAGIDTISDKFVRLVVPDKFVKFRAHG